MTPQSQWEGLRAGDPIAFKTLFDTFYAPLFIQAKNKGLDDVDAEEVVSKCFTALWEYRHSIEHVNLGGYLGRSVNNACIDHYRQKTAKAGLQDPSVDQLPDQLPDDYDGERILIIKQFIEVVLESIEQLPAQQKLVFRLHFFEHRKNEEIAHMLAISNQLVRAHLSAAKKRLRLLIPGEYWPILSLLPAYWIIFLK